MTTQVPRERRRHTPPSLPVQNVWPWHAVLVGVAVGGHPFGLWKHGSGELECGTMHGEFQV